MVNIFLYLVLLNFPMVYYKYTLVAIFYLLTKLLSFIECKSCSKQIVVFCCCFQALRGSVHWHDPDFPSPDDHSGEEEASRLSELRRSRGRASSQEKHVWQLIVWCYWNTKGVWRTHTLVKLLYRFGIVHYFWKISIDKQVDNLITQYCFVLWTFI